MPYGGGTAYAPKKEQVSSGGKFCKLILKIGGGGGGIVKKS